MEKLTEIDWIFNTDKGSHAHGYTEKYQRYLPFDRDDRIQILEIGVFEGESLLMWSEWFRIAQIVGIDIHQNCTKYADPEKRIAVEIGNQTSEPFIRSVIDRYGSFNLVIDDGSHINSEQIRTFEILFPLLEKGAMYVIEDTHTSYWSSYGGGIKKNGSCIEYFKNIIDEVNFYGEMLTINEAKHNSHYRRDDWMLKQFADRNMISKDIYSINFMNSLIFIQKR